MKPQQTFAARSITRLGAALVLAAAASSAAAVPMIEFTPSATIAEVGDVFVIQMHGSGFGSTSAGAVIGNVTGGQTVNLSFTGSIFEVLSVSIDGRWSYAAGNKPGVIDGKNGRITGLSFGSFPATSDDDFAIASFTLRALAPGKGNLALDSGKFVGQVGGRGGQNITAGLGQAAVTVVPEPQQWALLLVGLIGVVYATRSSARRLSKLT